MSLNDDILTLINFFEVHAGSYKDRDTFENSMEVLVEQALDEVIDEYFPDVDEEA